MEIKPGLSAFVTGGASGIGIKESDTGLALPSQWDLVLVSDKQMMQEEQPLQRNFASGL